MTDECADQERDLGNVYPPCHQRGGSVWIRYHPEAARFFSGSDGEHLLCDLAQAP